jgi:hypothetical protein
MNARDQRIHDEATALWRELYGQPPPIRADGATMLDVNMRSLPEVSYDRLRSPYLRPSTLTGPATGASGA